ncbi:MAG: serine kinase [Alphaproteobacteria bacterium]|nr:serine kinase [Alphaproteobacteria bacterium]
MGTNIHASCVDFLGQGILITGISGSGKSDLCLRLIMEQGAKLVADDRVNLTLFQDNIIATAPTILQGLLEVRGVGIINIQYCPQTSIKLAINLINDFDKIERMPEEKYFEFRGKKIRCFDLYGKDSSIVSKVLAALTLV